MSTATAWARQVVKAMECVRVIIRSSRPPFLFLTLVCVALGITLARTQTGRVDVGLTLLILLGALSAHVSVNALNEYHDFKSGLDSLTSKTPFSGGSGALQQFPQAAASVKNFGIACFLLTILIGIILLPYAGLELLVIGGLGLLLIASYTPWLNRHPLLCLAAPGAGFGLFMVLGTYWILAGQPDWPVVLLTLVPFFLVNNILLLNQYPDISADKLVGRKTAPIVFGTTVTSIIYTVFSLLSYFIVIGLVAITYLPLITLVVIVPAILSFRAAKAAFELGEAVVAHPKYLAANVNAGLLTIAIITMGLWFA